MKQSPTIFHITHAKTGSQWIRSILSALAPKRIVPPIGTGVEQFTQQPLEPGKIYPALFIYAEKFYELLLPTREALGGKPLAYSPGSEAHIKTNWQNFVQDKKPYKKVIIIRDLRDTLISLYFSMKISHPPGVEPLVERREIITPLSQQEGLLWVLTHDLRAAARMQRSWVGELSHPQTLFLKYEDLLADEAGNINRIVDFCELSVLDSKLKGVIEHNSFRNVSGREPGTEDVHSHQRKGIAGDWKNYFDAQITKEFKRLFGDLLIATGYEKDSNW